MRFNIEDFHKKSVTKFYYEKGRHASTSLRSYDGKLFVHKLLGYRYYGVNKEEYGKLIILMNDLGIFFKKHTSIIFPHVVYLGYDKINNCIERIEEYSGNTLGYIYPTSSDSNREKIIDQLLDHIKSIVEADENKEELIYSIDPTPDNFTYDGDNIYYIDFMPPLVKSESINPHFISDKSRTSEDISTQMIRYFTQKGMYLTFLTKFGAADISNFQNLFKKTLASIGNNAVVNYLYNDIIKSIEGIVKKKESYYSISEAIDSVMKESENIERDLLRLIGVYFITDNKKIEMNAKKYRVKEIISYIENKRCAADIVKGLIYSELRDSSSQEQLKNIVIKLTALQYGY